MASGLSRPLTRSLQGRMFSAAAQAEARVTADDREPRCYVKKLDNGMLVGTIETQSPLSRLAVVANAGSRFETGDNLGITHLLRRTTKLRTENLSGLGIARSSLQLGSDITVQGTHEYLYYKSAVSRDNASKIVDILRELTTKQVFKPWEVNDLQSEADGLKFDLALLRTQPQVRLVELLHSAAFRDTLGQSLYAPDFSIGKFTPEQLSQYVRTYFSSGRLALVGVGIDNLELEEYARQFDPYPAVNVPTQKAAYQGGEVRENVGGPLSYVAVAFGGPSQTSAELLPSEVLRHVMGIGPRIKYSDGTSVAQLGKAVTHASSAPFAVSSLSANYSDSGLIGFTAVAPTSDIEKVTRAAAQQFKSVLSSGLKDEDINRAKNQLKAEICMQFENPDILLGWLGEQTLNSDQVLTPQEVYKMVDAIKPADVNSVAKKIVATKPSMAVTGNTNNVPYLDKLFS